MLDLIKAEVQARQVFEIVQALDVRDEVIVEIEIYQRSGDICGEGDA